MSVCMHVFVSNPEAINNQWRDVVWYRPHMIGQGRRHQSGWSGFHLTTLLSIVVKNTKIQSWLQKINFYKVLYT